jgi:hypothetical protein
MGSHDLHISFAKYIPETIGRVSHCFGQGEHGSSQRER